MVALIAGFLENLAQVRADDGVGREDQARFPLGGAVDLGLVDGAGFGLGGQEDVFEGGEGFVLVLGEGAGDDVQVC